MPRAPSTRPPSAGSGSGARSRARNNPKTRSLNAFSIAQSTATATATRRRRPSKHTTTADPDPDTTSSTRRADSASIDGGSDSDGGHWRVGVGSGDDSESDIDSDEALGASDEERFAGFAFRGSSSSGNKNKKKEKKGVVTLDESDSDDDDEEEDDGEGFVDLSEMLDRATPSGSESGEEEEEEEEAAGKLQKNRPKKRAAPESESEDDSAGGLELEEPSMSEADDDSGSDSDSSDSFAHFSEEEEEDDDGGDPAALAALQSRIAALPSGSKHASKRARLDTDPNEGKTPNEYNLAPTPHTKLTITDLLPTIADRTLKKSLKTLSSDSTTAKSSGMQAGKLAAPLPKRQQDRIDRAAAYVQTTTTLGRWAATVKTQREAEHLRFPLPNAPNAPVATPQRLLSLSATEARGGGQTELEATVSRILKESNMASERKLAEFEELQTNRMSVEEVQRRTAELRMARELMYREELRAKRVKKIKSKAYRRVHKKERARQEQAVEEALALERGGKGAEAEEEAMERERRRAEERMTLRHKQSRWAKGMRESGRSVWDDEAQEGAVEMARRVEELTRRIRGKGVRGEFGESGSGSSSSSEDGEDEEDEDDDAFDEEGVELRRKLAKDIEKAEASLGVSGAGSKLGGRLMGMKFMQTAEAAKRKENDAQLEELKSMLMDADRPGRGSEGEDDEDEKEQEEQQHKQASGRMTFRPGKKEKEKKRPSAADRSEFEEQDLSGQEQQDEDGEEEQEDEEDDKVTFVNRANAAGASSSTAPKNPFTAPRTTAGAAGGKHTSFGASNDTAPAAAGNPWLPQDAPPHPQRKQPTLSSSTKTESRTERSSKKLARTRHAALAPAEAEAEVEIDTSATLQLAPKKQQPTPADADGDDSEGEADAKDIHLIPAHKGGGKAAQSQRALVRRAFAGDDVVAQFAEEKRAVVAAEGDRVVDERLPGWGSWAGEGLPQSQTQDDRFVKVVKGVVAPERRKDRRLARVVVNEKRVKKNIKYHASALPHVFETRQQYERSLRIPIGPEWATKTTFQDATMPRVVVKRGVVVEPISAPFK